MFKQKLLKINIPHPIVAFKWIFLLLLLLLPIVITLSDYGMTYDESIYQAATRNIQKWFTLEPDEIFNPDIIDKYWKTDPMLNTHPSGIKWIYLTAQKLIFWEDNPYRQNGILNAMIFSFSTLLFLQWWRKDSFSTHVIYIFFLLTIPRFFAHIHFPATDIPMISFLLILIVCMDRLFFKRLFFLTGIILGIFLSIKFTSLLLLIPVFVMPFIKYRHDWKKVFTQLALVCIIALLTFYMLNPDYWFSPFSRVREFLQQTLTRRSWIPISVLFNGQHYSYRGPLYYPFVMFFITTPILHSLFLITGITVVTIKKRLGDDPKTVLLLICLIFPFLILTLPISPAHDGIRYLLPAFPFALCFMTLGFKYFWKFIRDRSNTHPLKKSVQWISVIIASLILAGDLKSPARYPPFELSYYNRIVGGISGAYKKGYETTYWWEVVNNNVIEVLNTICDGSYVFFPWYPTHHYFNYMVEAEHFTFMPTGDINEAQFMVIVGRPYVKFWEIRTRPSFNRMGKEIVKIWGISLDSIPLIQLYTVLDIKYNKD